MIGFIILIMVSWFCGMFWGFVLGHQHVMNEMRKVIANKKTKVEDLRPR